MMKKEVSLSIFMRDLIVKRADNINFESLLKTFIERIKKLIEI